jgi:hypothetical protein
MAATFDETLGGRGAGLFDFGHKSHPNRETKMYVVRFGSIGF